MFSNYIRWSVLLYKFVVLFVHLRTYRNDLMYDCGCRICALVCETSAPSLVHLTDGRKYARSFDKKMLGISIYKLVNPIFEISKF